MDQAVQRVRIFDSFTLDLYRGCVQKGSQQVDVTPKAFEVLTYLTANAGRLVPKQELFEAVWPNIAVSDDSLVQCIRELRRKLGDHSHTLIKTVPRRGYMLDAAPSAPSVPVNARLERLREIAARLALDRFFGRMKALDRRSWALAVGLLFSLAFGVLFAPLGATESNDLFTRQDAERVTAIANSKQLPLPQFRIGKPDRPGSTDARRFVGVWVSDKGWAHSNRQMMLIVTNADNGMVAGYVVHGPPQPRSPIQSPAHFRAFKTSIAGASFSYADPSGQYTATLTSNDHIAFTVAYRDGGWGGVVLDPVWTLIAAEPLAHRHVIAR